MVDLELSDIHIGILTELYWNGNQQSRTTQELLEDIEYLINTGLVEEFQKDMVFWEQVLCVRITERGVDVLKLEIDPLRVFNVFLTITDSVSGASTWVMMFDLFQLPVAFAHPEEEIRDAAEARLMEIEDRIELSDNELTRMMACYRAVAVCPGDWIPSRAERRLILLGLISATPNGSGNALNLTDKGAKFLEHRYFSALVEFLVGCLDGGPELPTLYDSYHVNRLLKLISALPAEHLVELLASENDFIRGHAIRRQEQLNEPWP